MLILFISVVVLFFQRLICSDQLARYTFYKLGLSVWVRKKNQAHGLLDFVLRARVLFSDLIKRILPISFSDTAITDHQPDTTFSTSEYTGRGFPGLVLHRKNRSNMCGTMRVEPATPCMKDRYLIH